MTPLFILAATLLAASPADSVEPRLTAYFRTGAQLHLSASQTAGGIGGGAGARLRLTERFFAQADAAYLGMLGSAIGVRVGAGLERSGLWRPSVRANLAFIGGQRLRFLMGERASPVVLPASSLGLVVAPLRFVTRQTEFSILELGAGIGWDFPGLATAIDLTVLEVGFRF
jgi:hypothetical protein